MRSLNSNFLLWIAIILVILLLVGNLIVTGLNNGGDAINSDTPIIDFVREPVVATAIGAILVFLLVDRWRKIEKEISEIQKGQIDSLKKIREDAENIIKGRIEATTRKAKSLEDKIGTLTEQHPWITSITENDLIPDTQSCRIVLRTCEYLYEIDRLPLIYEYLYSWIKKGSDEPNLMGNAEDFIDLVEFCERYLGDEYLGFALTEKAVVYASNPKAAYPDYLNRLIRHGKYSDSKRIARSLTRTLPLAIGNYRIYRNFRINTNQLLRSYLALALFESLSVRREKLERYLKIAYKISEPLNATDLVKCTHAEIFTMMGDHKSAKKMIEELSISPFYSKDEDVIFSTAQTYRTIGESSKYIDLIKRLRNDGLSQSRENESNPISQEVESEDIKDMNAFRLEVDKYLFGLHQLRNNNPIPPIDKDAPTK